ncbi:unnamed protein product [Ambrosiozyma monospora]|uniref:Unnamed protein product n=1 Tax=Ambrosiozyma monospora TaxID=43982 RepID=A0ACB5U5Q9_AMBMO|nr:unnamed protein product [Ambrosiozyma monospora]
MVLFHEHGHGHSHSHGSSSHAHTHGFVIDDEEDDDNRIQDLEMMPHCHSHSEDHHHHDDHDHHDHYRHYHHETSKETAVASSSSTSSLNTDDSDSITVIQSPLLNQAHKSNDESSTSSSPSSSISTSFSPSSVSTSTYSETHATHNHYLKTLNPSSSDSKSHKSLNIEGVFLHVMGDAMANLGVILSALFIWKTDFEWRHYVDPLVTLLIVCFIVFSTWPLCQKTARMLLHRTPTEVDLSELERDLLLVDHVSGVDKLRCWSLNEKIVVCSLRVELKFDDRATGTDEVSRVVAVLKECLAAYGITDSTIETDVVDGKTY